MSPPVTLLSGRRGPNPRAELFQSRISTEKLQEELRIKETERKENSQKHYLSTMTKMTSGGQLSWEEKRALVVYDKLQQEEYAKEKRRRALEVQL